MRPQTPTFAQRHPVVLNTLAAEVRTKSVYISISPPADLSSVFSFASSRVGFTNNQASAALRSDHTWYRGLIVAKMKFKTAKELDSTEGTVELVSGKYFQSLRM